MKDTKSAKSTTASDTTYEGFTDEERAAMKNRAKELKAAARRGSRADKADAESEVLATIAEGKDRRAGDEGGELRARVQAGRSAVAVVRRAASSARLATPNFA